MWNPFKRKFLVCIDECFNSILAALKQEDSLGMYRGDVWSWLEAMGVERKWSWRTHKNYLVFNNEEEYTMFLLRLG